jgi:hypothetical protein
MFSTPLCIHRLVQHLDFGIPDMTSVKRRSRQPILGLWCLVRIFGFMKRTISICAYVISLITPNHHHLYHPPVFDSLRICVVVRHVYIAL